MKKIKFILNIFIAFYANAQSIKTTIDLVNVKEDKAAVTMEFPKMKSSDVKFNFPKTVPGTYSTDDYGRFIEGIKFFDNKGKELAYNKVDDNSYSLKNAKSLAKVTYFVNDSFDEEMNPGEHKEVFSPSGTDIEQDKVYLINTHGFVGYIDDMQDVPYQLSIQKPKDFYGTTALVDQDKSELTDTYILANYAKLTDSPILYSKPDYFTFNANGMEVVLGLYSVTGKYKAIDFKDNLEKMIIAQKKFLGDMNSNKKYAILLYLSDFTGKGPMIKGFGALEHHESTSVVLPEMMPKEQIDKTLTDVISHEFFHTVTPLKTHSEEIHYFNYTNPKMSQHLWMYEGGTEYFANLFQIQEGLINKEEFLDKINSKINSSKKYNDTLSFTVMSKNVLLPEFKKEYTNVYQKGALLTMCLDIELRKLSNGEIGYRDMIRKLSLRFGENKPFKDDELIDELVTITGYPQIKTFYNKYIAGNQPIPYVEYLGLVGIEQNKESKSYLRFTNEEDKLGFNPLNNTLMFIDNPSLTNFAINIGLKTTDQIVDIDGKKPDINEIDSFTNYIKSIKDGQDVTIAIIRNGTKMDLKGKAILEKSSSNKFVFKSNPTPEQQKLQDQWLTGKK